MTHCTSKSARTDDADPLQNSKTIRIAVKGRVITREALQGLGPARLGELLRKMPEFPGNPVTDMVAFNSARGVTADDVRGLASDNTLVPVNGRRTTSNASVFDVTTTFVDMNRFSPALIERVEILKGGASAVSGADAVSGVINIITRRHPGGYGNTRQ